MGLILALIAASAVVVWGLERPVAVQEVLAGSGRSVTMWTVGPLLLPDGLGADRFSLSLVPPGSDATPLVTGYSEGLGPVFIPDVRPMELKLVEFGLGGVERPVGRVPLKAGLLDVGRRVQVTGVPLRLVHGDPRALELRRSLQSRGLADVVAEAAAGSPESVEKARVWQVRLYPTETTTYAEVYVVWELSEQARMMTRMVLPGNVGVRFVCQTTPQGLRVLPSRGLYGFPSPEAGVLLGWQSLGEAGRAKVEAALPR